MAEPWFEPVWKFGAYFGACWGTFIGLSGAVLGGFGGGYLVPRGIGRPWILGSMIVLGVAGWLLLAAGAYAWSVGQPYGIWYTLVGSGLCPALLFPTMVPIIAKRYDEAEQRKIDAAGVRNA
ncbi:MAG: hypothetical protein AAF805_06250 [Planctomycetota bacterium]